MSLMSKEETDKKTYKKETFLQGVVTLIFSQILIKLLILLKLDLIYHLIMNQKI